MWDLATKNITNQCLPWDHLKHHRSNLTRDCWRYHLRRPNPRLPLEYQDQVVPIMNGDLLQSIKDEDDIPIKDLLKKSAASDPRRSDSSLVSASAYLSTPVSMPSVYDDETYPPLDKSASSSFLLRKSAASVMSNATTVPVSPSSIATEVIPILGNNAPIIFPPLSNPFANEVPDPAKIVIVDEPKKEDLIGFLLEDLSDKVIDLTAKVELLEHKLVESERLREFEKNKMARNYETALKRYVDGGQERYNDAKRIKILEDAMGKMQTQINSMNVTVVKIAAKNTSFPPMK